MTHKAAANTTTKYSRSDNFSIMFTLGCDALSVAWRIAVPVIAGAVLGIIADRKWDTAPWLTLALTLVGFVAAGGLIKKQIREIERREAKR